MSVDGDIESTLTLYKQEEQKENPFLNKSGNFIYVTSQLQFPQSTSRKEMEPYVQDFLRNSKKHVLLLTGSAGAGKSTILEKIEANYLKNHKDTLKDWLPIRISLAHPILTEAKGRLMQQLLQFKGFTPEQAGDLQRGKIPLVILLDAYDEAKNLGLVNLIKLNRFRQDWPSCKVIITSRPEAFNSISVDKLFGADQSYGGTSVLEHMQVPSFNIEQQNLFMKEYVKKLPQDGTIDEKWQTINNYEIAIKKYNLTDVIDVPFLLQISMQVLPNIVQKNAILGKKESESIKLTHNEMFHEFIEQWFIREEEKLLDQGNLTVGTKKAAMWRYAKKLAYQMSVENITFFENEDSETSILTGWRDELLNFDKLQNLHLFSAIPKISEGRHEKWLHKSIMEFLVMGYQKDQMKNLS